MIPLLISLSEGSGIDIMIILILLSYYKSFQLLNFSFSENQKTIHPQYYYLFGPSNKKIFIFNGCMILAIQPNFLFFHTFHPLNNFLFLLQKLSPTPTIYNLTSFFQQLFITSHSITISE